MGSQGPVAPFLEACLPSKEAVSPEGDIHAVTQNEQQDGATGDADGSTPGVGSACAPLPGVSPSASSSNGLGHHGEPADSEEGERDRPQEKGDEAQEEQEAGVPARLVRAPRTPSQSERELHEAVHLPHAEWCEYCVRGRGRNKPHKSRNKRKMPRMSIDITEYPWEGATEKSQEDAPSVPKVSLDYFS